MLSCSVGRVDMLGDALECLVVGGLVLPLGSNVALGTNVGTWLDVGIDEGWDEGAKLREGLPLSCIVGRVDKLGEALGADVGSRLAVGIDEG